MESTIGRTATTVFIDEQGYTCIKYHNTVVVKFKGNKIRLDSAGFRTATTKRRMNQASKKYNLGFSVFQNQKKWYVENECGVKEFYDYMTLQKKQIDWTRINNDTNGNPRYVCHYTVFSIDSDSGEGIDLTDKYAAAVKRANKIGGRKYHNKKYGGGIVFQSYNIDDTETSILSIIDN